MKCDRNRGFPEVCSASTAGYGCACRARARARAAPGRERGVYGCALARTRQGASGARALASYWCARSHAPRRDRRRSASAAGGRQHPRAEQTLIRYCRAVVFVFLFFFATAVAFVSVSLVKYTTSHRNINESWPPYLSNFGASKIIS